MHYHYSSSQLQQHAGWSKEKLFLAGEWLIPLVVWLVVVTLGLAIAGLLLGEQ